MMTDTVTLVGNVASTPASTVTPSGVTVLAFRLATNSRRFDAKAGEWIDTGTNWYRISVYRWLAENAASSLAKGDAVIVTGRLRLREWESSGRRGISPEVDADALGPDLRWGISHFTRVPRSAPALTGESGPGPDRQDARAGMSSSARNELEGGKRAQDDVEEWPASDVEGVCPF